MDILFWSGGKDSYLALEFFSREYDTGVLKLLTTYDRSSDRVPHQQIPLPNIKQQAETLGLDIIAVALPPECPNAIYLERIRETLTEEDRDESIRYLVFGDWYLKDIRSWREKKFGEMGYECVFPIWRKKLDDLLPVLTLKPVTVRISAVSDEYQKYLKPGEEYNQILIRQLPEEIDPMGEKGEFHTEVTFESWDESSISR